MAQFKFTETEAAYIDKVIENAREEKVLIADALTTAVEGMKDHVDQEEYLNICAVLGRYNRLLSILG